MRKCWNRNKMYCGDCYHTEFNWIAQMVEHWFEFSHIFFVVSFISYNISYSVSLYIVIIRINQLMFVILYSLTIFGTINSIATHLYFNILYSKRVWSIIDSIPGGALWILQLGALTTLSLRNNGQRNIRNGISLSYLKLKVRMYLYITGI